MKTILGVALAIVVFLLTWLAFYLGVHKPVEITYAQVGPLKVVYKEHLGAYHKIVPVIEEVEKWAQANDVLCESTFGEYLDDPRKGEEDRLRSHGGCIVEKEWTNLPEDFFYKEIERRDYLVARFEGAPSIGPMKVYPKATKWIEENGYKISGPVIEIYRITPEQRVETEYLFPVSNP